MRAQVSKASQWKKKRLQGKRASEWATCPGLFTELQRHPHFLPLQKGHTGGGDGLLLLRASVQRGSEQCPGPPPCTLSCSLQACFVSVRPLRNALRKGKSGFVRKAAWDALQPVLGKQSLVGFSVSRAPRVAPKRTIGLHRSPRSLARFADRTYIKNKTRQNIKTLNPFMLGYSCSPSGKEETLTTAG
ncbi:hypothetical protein SKAU_G00398930 [Synaphobranchus kaupii]|uniref:Uncharacterized protein n=1 Tax=Synaphobranchus kaupii TaxID=118154 RepID=A0A9Q1E8N3_SYNKA|nr:hypothetical protein SKAU_G00398930 [Synaphobranchus kaupii]